MKIYERPVLQNLGMMADVTRKSGPFTDPGQPEPAQDFTDLPDWAITLCKSALGPFIPFCSPFYP